MIKDEMHAILQEMKIKIEKETRERVREDVIQQIRAEVREEYRLKLMSAIIRENIDGLGSKRINKLIEIISDDLIEDVKKITSKRIWSMLESKYQYEDYSKIKNDFFDLMVDRLLNEIGHEDYAEIEREAERRIKSKIENEVYDKILDSLKKDFYDYDLPNIEHQAYSSLSKEYKIAVRRDILNRIKEQMETLFRDQ